MNMWILQMSRIFLDDLFDKKINFKDFSRPGNNHLLEIHSVCYLPLMVFIACF